MGIFIDCKISYFLSAIRVKYNDKKIKIKYNYI